jgi:hypothetical protein
MSAVHKQQINPNNHTERHTFLAENSFVICVSLIPSLSDYCGWPCCISAARAGRMTLLSCVIIAKFARINQLKLLEKILSNQTGPSA